MVVGVVTPQQHTNCVATRPAALRSRVSTAFLSQAPRQLPYQRQPDTVLGDHFGLQPAGSLRQQTCKRRRDVIANAHSDRNGSQDLPVSLYWPYKNLPPDGKTRTEGEELCNPEERSCQTPMHVFERKCRPCTGTGMISSNSRGRRRVSSYTCPICHGLGFVRHTSSRFIPPNLNNGTGDFTLGRPVPPPEEEEGKKRKFPFRR